MKENRVTESAEREGSRFGCEAVAVVPAGKKPKLSCVVFFGTGERKICYCSAERYMDFQASLTGNDNRACRRMFRGRRGTGLLFNDGRAYLQVKLREEAPSLGYILLPALEEISSTKDGKCRLLAAGMTFDTCWTRETFIRHLFMVLDTFPGSVPCRVSLIS